MNCSRALARAVTGVLLVGCGSSGSVISPYDAGGPVADTGSVTPRRGASGTDAGHPRDAAPRPGDAPDAASPAPIKIKHVVVIVKENHTFDNFFGTFPGANGAPKDSTGAAQCPTGKVLPTGKLELKACLEAPDVVGHDLCHLHSCALADWDQGKLDGWSTPAGSDNGGIGDGDGMVYKQYLERDIPNYWALARKFALADNFYSNMLGPSFPGHLFTVAAQAGWAIGNPPTDLTANPLRLSAGEKLSPYWGCDEFKGGAVTVAGITVNTYAGDTVEILPDGGPAGDGGVATEGGLPVAEVFPCFKIKAIPDVLPEGVTWGFYGTDWSELADTTAIGNLSYPIIHEPWSMLDAVDGIRNGARWGSNVVVTGAPWDTGNPVQLAIQSGTLPDVTWIVDQDEFSEHPDLNLNQFASWISFPLGGVCDGENWTAGYISMLMNSAYWQDTAILVTWDDFGGWYDHVAPPRQYGGTAAQPYGLGFRLPLLIVSPYARPGFVFHEQSEQASIARFIEKVFGSTQTLSDLDPAAQDGQANDLLGAFDFSQTPIPPLALPKRDCAADGGH